MMITQCLACYADLSEIDFIEGHNVECPSCGEVHETDWDYFGDRDEESIAL